MSNESTPDPKPAEASEGTPKASEAAAKTPKGTEPVEAAGAPVEAAEAPEAAAETPKTPVEPAAEPAETPAEPVADESAEAPKAPAEPVAEAVETPAEPVTEVVETPAEETPAETPAEAAKAEEPETAAVPTPAPSPESGPKVLRVPGSEEEDEEPKSGKGRLIAIAVVAIVVVVGVVFAFNVFGSKEPSSAAAGDCLSLSAGTVENSTLQLVDCDADNAVLKVGKRFENDTDTCPEESFYQPYPAEGKPAEGFRLCMIPNLVEGACYVLDESGDNYVKGDCKGQDALKVVKIIMGSDDTSQCPDGAGEPYPEPKLVYCFAPGDI
jgi:hypothetical protein